MDEDMTYECKFYVDARTEYKLYKNICEQLDPKTPRRRNLFELKNYCYYGFVNEELRSSYWKLFLNYLPENKFKTEYFLKERRKCYHYYYENINEMDNIDSKKVLIDDMNRVNIFQVNDESKVVCDFLDAKVGDGTHRDAIKRILICFAATNSSIGYIQGMNMIVIPIYYVFATSKNEDDKKYAEEDTYFCFHHLMAEIGENFIQELDYDHRLGVRTKMNRVIKIIRIHNPELYENLKEKGVLETMFHLRWVMLLLSHEFQIEQVVLLWDKFLSDKNRFEMVEYCSASIVLLMCNALMEADFDSCMALLQKPLDDALTIFFYADKLRKDDSIRNSIQQ
ncbi:TBC1 domain family member 13 [Dictyocoela muelleri]|nr:TBC1 domain family member 13 [Dictyocoela muelleri]